MYSFNVKFQLFPANTTLKLQHMDQGIILVVKIVSDLLKQNDFFQVMNWIKQSRVDVEEEIIQNYFLNCIF